MYAIREDYISMPNNIMDVHNVMRPYINLGLSGCIGSIDVVHVRWDACSAGDHNLFVGKEGFPTIAWEVIRDMIEESCLLV